MPMAMRCSLCALNWPNLRPQYATCPKCGEATSMMNNCEPMTAAEAKSAEAHAKFEAYLAAESEEDKATRLGRADSELSVRDASPERAGRPQVTDEVWDTVVQTFNSSPDIS